MLFFDKPVLIVIRFLLKNSLFICNAAPLEYNHNIYMHFFFSAFQGKNHMNAQTVRSASLTLGHTALTSVVRSVLASSQ